jgi:DNA-binding transcriptional LysR family regulator
MACQPQTLLPGVAPNPVDARLLQLFDLLHRSGSVTQSAQALGLSQPTVSIWLAKLRRQFNDPLFVRTALGMQATPRADALIENVRTAMAALQALASAEPVFNPFLAQRTFRICMTDASHITLLPQLLKAVREQAPQVTLEAARMDADMALALQTGQADLAIGLIPQLEAGFYQQALFEQDWVCLSQMDHPRIRNTLSLRQYAAESHIRIATGTGAALLNQALASNNTTRRVVLDLPGFLGLPAILASTDLIVTLPRQIGETLAAYGGLKVLKCPLNIEGFTVKQHWHARYHHDPANQWLRALCAQLFGQNTRTFN